MKTRNIIILFLIGMLFFSIVAYVSFNSAKNRSEIANDSISTSDSNHNQEQKETETAPIHKDEKNGSEQNDEEVNGEENDTNEELSLFISNYHEAFNQITNYEQYETINWDELQVLAQEMIGQIDVFLSGDVPDEMKLDFERIMYLAEIGIENHDPNVAIYIHRILHDLDIEYNGYEQTKFGFSNYDGGGAEQQTVAQYIKEHKEMVGTD